MNPPFIIFCDDGVNVYSSIQEMCSHIENWIVEESPQWCRGYDAGGTPFKLVPGNRIPKIERDEAAALDINERQRESMIEFLIGGTSNAKDLGFLGNRELFQKVVEAAARILGEKEAIEKTRLERRQNHPIARAILWVSNLFRK